MNQIIATSLAENFQQSSKSNQILHLGSLFTNQNGNSNQEDNSAVWGLCDLPPLLFSHLFPIPFVTEGNLFAAKKCSCVV